MKRISTLFYTKSTFWVCVILTIICFGYLYLVMIPATECYTTETNEEISLGTSFGFTFEVVRNYLSSMTDEMLDCYRTFHHLWDNIFAILYGLMYTAWISLLFKPWSTKFKALNFLPFVQTVFDWLENYQLSGLAFTLLTDEEITKTGVQVASVFNMVKWIVSGVIFLMILVGVALRVMRYMRQIK